MTNRLLEYVQYILVKPKKAQNGYKGLIFALLALSVFAFVTVYSYTRTSTPVSAATNSTINFQARLLTSTGALVPDGTYNVEFKIYDSLASGASAQGACSLDSSTDDCWWRETREGGNKVTVKNGYFSVNLGSVTAFGSSVPWDQELWLTLNIGGTGSPSYDGEMTPRTKLTAVPYAFRANTAFGVASDNTNSASTNSGNVTITTGNAAGATSNSGNLTVDTGTATGTTGTISIGTTNSSGLILGRAGSSTTIQGSSASSFVLNGVTVSAAEFNVLDGGIEAGDLTTQGTATDEYCLTYESGGGALLQWQDCGSGVTLQTAYNAGNTITLTDARDLTITAADTATDPNIIFNLAGAGDLIVQDAGNAVFTINDNGTVVFRTQTDSTTGFQIQDSDGGTPILSVNTTDERIGIGTSSPSTIFQVGDNGVNNRLNFDNTSGSTLTLYSNNENALVDIVSGWGGGDNPYLKIRRGNSSNGISLTVGTISADRTLTLPDENGTVCTTGSICSGYQASLGYTAANVALSNLSGVNINTALNTTSGNLALQTTTSGDITLTPAVSAGLVNILTGSLKVGNATPDISLNGEDAYIEGTLEVDGSITLGSDTINDFTGNGLTLSSNVLTLQVVASADALSATTSSGSGLEVLTSGIALLQGCSNNQVLQWNETTDVWACSSAGTGDVVNGGQNGTVTIGSNDSNNLAFETDGTTRWYIDTSGNLLPNVNDSYDIGSTSLRVRDLYLGGETLRIGTAANDEAAVSYTTATNTLTISNTATSSSGGTIFSNSANSATAFQIQNSSGTSLFNVNNLTSGLNLIANPSFESNTNGWSLRNAGGSPTIARDDTASNAQFGSATLALVTSTTANNGVQYNYPFAPSTQYTLSFYAKRSATSSTAWAVGRADNGSDTNCTTSPDITSVGLTTTWTNFSCTFTTGATIGSSSNFYIKQTDTTTDTIYIDGVTLVTGSTALTYTNPANNIQVDANYSNITLNNLNTGELQPWQLNANGLPGARGRPSSVTANGYAYLIGGSDGTIQSTVYYAKLNADGSTGAWSTNANALPAARFGHTSVYANGYIYVIGGENPGTTYHSTVYYAKVNVDGSTGAWQTNANALPGSRAIHSSVVSNGYVYVIGGYTNAGYQSTVYYAKLNADGSTGAWQTNANALPASRGWHSSVVSNGYVYVIGGYDSVPVIQSTVYYARLNTDGSIGSWQTSSYDIGCTTAGCGSPSVRARHMSVVSNGYVYVIGGTTGSDVQTVYFAKLNADGSVGAWQTSSNALPRTVTTSATIVNNGYIYSIGGSVGGSNSNIVYYTSTARILASGSLDLVGSSGQNLNEGGTGGSLTAGNTTIVGQLRVQEQAVFSGGVSIDNGLTANGSMYFNVQGTGTETVTYVRSAGTGASASTSMDIGSANTNRVVVVYASDDSTGTNLSGVTVGGKQCNFVALEDEITGHIEMWYCDEDDLGSLSGTQTIAATGADASWAVHAHLYTGTNQGGPYDSGTGFAASSASVTVTGIDTPANGMVIMGAHESAGAKTIVSWTSPLTTRLDGPDPTSASLFTASGTETSAQTNKSYTFTFNSSSNDELAIVASWGGADYGARFNLNNNTSFAVQDAGNDVLRVSSDGTTLIQAPSTTTQAALRVVGAINTSVSEGLWTPSLVIDNAPTSTQNVIELRVAGTRAGSLRVDNGGNIVLNPAGTTGDVYLNWDEGSGETNFGNGNGTAVAQTTAAGIFNARANGAAGGAIGYQIAGAEMIYYNSTNGYVSWGYGGGRNQFYDFTELLGGAWIEGIADSLQYTVAVNDGFVCWDDTAFGSDLWGRCASTRDKKDNIETIDLGLDAVRALQPRMYNWIENGKAAVGFIADEVASVDTRLATYDSNGTLVGVDWAQIGAVAIKGIQELDVQNQQQQSDIVAIQSGQFDTITSVGNASVGGNLTVTGDLIAQNITAVGVMSTLDLSVSGTATVQKLKVQGLAEFAGDINLVGAVNTQQVLTKIFKAAGPMPAGSVVVIDETQDGYVKTTSILGDTKIVGVLVQDAATPGQEVRVAIEGSIQVKFGASDTVTAGSIVVASDTSGEAKPSATPGVGQVLGKTTSAKDANNLAWVLINLQ